MLRYKCSESVVTMVDIDLSIVMLTLNLYQSIVNAKLVFNHH